MKIKKLKTTLIEYNLDRIMGDANSPMGRKKASSCVVEIITDEGLRGISLGGQNSIPQINSIFEEILINNDPKAVMSTWKKMIEKFFRAAMME